MSSLRIKGNDDGGGATKGKKLGQKGIYIQLGIPEICAKISITVRADSADAQSRLRVSCWRGIEVLSRVMTSRKEN